jgi:CRISPR/Cas system endoribonuclease Cas6 (RAMP superfamily)
VVATNTVRAILNDAGKLVGIGNGRTIGMGRFDIIQFESEKLAVAV